MEVQEVMGLLGGLALFLYGMQMMSTGLEAAAGNKMRVILEKLTTNRFVGILVGALVTAVIQSSSATTVMVVGFVNSGMMTLNQAVWIIMGANIGTTITGQLIALDVGAMAPAIAFIGVAAVVFLKNDKVKSVGEIVAGLGVLFIGMDMMSTAMEPLRESETFVNIVTEFKNPLVGILAGAIFTAIIQSSSASVGILQGLAESGLIGLDSAAFVLFGQNIGTCITAFLASLGASKNAKRTTIVHILFNVIGTVIFTTLCLATPIISMVEGWTPGNPKAQIANMHTLFNVITTLLLLPLGTYLAKCAELILKDNGEEDEDVLRTMYLLDIKSVNADKYGASLVCLEGIRKELARMLEMAKSNVSKSFDVFANNGAAKYEEIEKKEEYVDYLNKEISSYITSLLSYENTAAGSRIFNAMYSVTSNIERLSDHAINIAGYSQMINEKNITFSEQANAEIRQMKATCEETMQLLMNRDDDVIQWHERIACMEQKIDDMTVEFRNNMYGRIKAGVCADQGSILFSEMLTDFERIGDHALNISNEMMAIAMVEKR